MSDNQCPDAATWKTFLDGDVLDDAAADLAAHLEDCEACQQTLERLAAGKETWEGTAKQLAEADATNAAAGVDSSGHLRDVLDDLKHGVEVGPTVTASSSDVLRFLDPSDQPDSIGRLDSYEIHEVVGAGGMGVVLRGWDPTLRRVVAIKVLASHLANSAAAKRRFVREAQAAAAVSHDHVVAIHAVEAEHEPPYLVMQYIDGKTLQQRIDATGPLDVKEILRIGQQTAQGLAAAHRQGIVHRDIKPANVLLENGVERVRITDFGLARAVDDASMTQSGVVAGTPLFMAPEQAQGQPIDHRADLFSLGSVLYAMATGRPPFRSSTLMGVIRRVCDEQARPIREINPDIPDWLCAIIDRLLAKEPADRFQSADEVAELLAGCLAHVQHPLSVPLPVSAGAAVTKSQGAPENNQPSGDAAQSTDEPSSGPHHLNETRRFERSDVDDAISAEEREILETARQLVRWPAVFLFVIGAVNCAIMVAVAGYLAVAAGAVTHVGLSIVWLLMPSAPLCIIGALRMWSLGSRAWAYAAVVMSLLGPGMVLALPIAIWALTRLSRSEVTAGFVIGERRRSAGHDSGRQSSGVGRRLVRVVIISMLFLTATGLPLAGYVLVQDSGAFPNIGPVDKTMLSLGGLAVVFGLIALLRSTEKKPAGTTTSPERPPTIAQLLRRVPEVLLCTILASFTMMAIYSDLTTRNYDGIMEAAVLPLFCMTLVTLAVVAFVNRRRIRELDESGRVDAELERAFRTAIWTPVGMLVPVIVLLSVWVYRQSTVGYVTFDVDDPMSIATFRNSVTEETRKWSASWKRVRLPVGKYEWTVSDGPMESIVLDSGSLQVRARTGQVLSSRIDKSESIRRLEGSWRYTSGNVHWDSAVSSPPDWARPPGTLAIQWNWYYGLHILTFAPKPEDIADADSEDFRGYACRVRADVYPKQISLLQPSPDRPPEDWPCVADGYWRVGTNGLYLMLRPPGQPALPSSYSLPVDRHVHYLFERVEEPESGQDDGIPTTVDSQVTTSVSPLNGDTQVYAEVLSVEGAAEKPFRAEIRVGEDSGLTPGDWFELTIQEDDGRRSTKGTIRVEQVFSDRTLIRLFEPAFAGRLTAGDTVILERSGQKPESGQVDR